MADPVSHLDSDDSMFIDAVERRLMGAPRRYKRRDLSTHAGVDADDTRRVWRALGFANSREADVAFSDTDLDALRAVSAMTAAHDLDVDTLLGLARALGRTTDRLAMWQVQLVVDMLASGGHPNPPTWSRVLWALMEGAIAIGLLLAGGLKALQAASLATALPFSVVLVLMCVATFKAVRYDYRRREEKEFLGRVEYVRQELQSNFDEHFGRQVDHRVDNRIDYRISRTTGPWGGGKHAKDDGRS